MGASRRLLSLLICGLVVCQRHASSIDILDKDDTYCNENNISDLICVPDDSIIRLIDEVISDAGSKLWMDPDHQDADTYSLFSNLKFVKNPLYSCRHPKSRLVELDNTKKAFMCLAAEELQKVLQCKSGYELTEVLVENPSKKLGYAESEIRPRTSREKKYAIKSDKLCIKTVKVPVEVTCKDGILKDGFCVQEETTNPLYECPAGLHVTPRKWCGYIRRELNETLMENVIKRTNPGCVVKTVHPWFKSTARVECYNSNAGYIVGITEDDWINVVPATVKCPKDFELVFPKYPTEESIKGDFTFPPICVAKRYFPRSISCPGILLRNGLIVTDRYVVDLDINPTPFKQYVDVSHYSCQIQDREKPNIVCPIISMERFSRTGDSFSSSGKYLSPQTATLDAIEYQSGGFDLVSYSRLMDRNPSIWSELGKIQRANLSSKSAVGVDNAEDAFSGSDLVNASGDSPELRPFYNNKVFKTELHEYEYYYNDILNKHLKSVHDYNNHESSYYPFRLNTTLDDPWGSRSGSNLRRSEWRDLESPQGGEKVISGRHFNKEYSRLIDGLKRQGSQQGEYFNDYQWDFLSRFYKVYVSNQVKFVSNIPVSSVSHKAQTIDGGYQLNINLDPTYQSFVNYTLEKMRIVESNLSLAGIGDSMNSTGEDYLDVAQVAEQVSRVKEASLNWTREHEYSAWERSARVYFMDLDLMKKNQILYSSISSYKHKTRFPFLYYYGKQPSLENDYGHVRRPAISDHKYRYGSPSEDYHRYTGRHQSSSIAYYISKHLNGTKPYRHPPGPGTHYNCISINETTPVIECPGQSIIIPRCFVLDIIYARLTSYYAMTNNESTIEGNVKESGESPGSEEAEERPIIKEGNVRGREDEKLAMGSLVSSRPVSIQEGLDELGDLEVLGSLEGSGGMLNELGYFGNIGELGNLGMLDNLNGFGELEV
ncbi:hypothetical protein OJ253_2597 [Cryptosporidium canis]|uniref:Uncharacterized protein n=1 Tax=Cryptosporidium canis TaxID=195482 RepID=A0A9D5DFJ1_9CRYT|nr:hypothetical protein OJ253_2597 [Cryptosporidium canis]